MIKAEPRKIDPDKVKHQMDLLVAAIWGVAEDMLAEQRAADAAGGMLTDTAGGEMNEPSIKQVNGGQNG